MELLKTTSNPNHLLALIIQDQGNATALNMDLATESPKVEYHYSDYKPAELAALGAVSLTLTLLNILCIFIAGILVLKVISYCAILFF